MSVSRREQLNNTLSFSILLPFVVSLFVGIEAVLQSFIEVTVVTYRDLYSYDYYDKHFSLKPVGISCGLNWCGRTERTFGQDKQHVGLEYNP